MSEQSTSIATSFQALDGQSPTTGGFTRYDIKVQTREEPAAYYCYRREGTPRCSSRARVSTRFFG